MTKRNIRILIVILLAIAGYSIFSTVSYRNGSDFKSKIDSLGRVNDSLVYENIQNDNKIRTLQALDSVLKYEIEHQKIKVVKVDRWIDSSKSKIDTYTEKELVSFLNSRYPEDTLSNPLPIAQPVLTSAAKDLVELDGTREKLSIKDSIISTQESRISLKDSTITLFIDKEGKYKAIIENKDKVILQWDKQYTFIQSENKKLKLQSKFQKIGTAVIAGVLIYTLIHK